LESADQQSLTGLDGYVNDEPFDERLIGIGKKVQDEARGHLASLASVARKIGDSLSEATDPEQAKRLGELLKSAKKSYKNAQIEKSISTLTERQLEAVGAWESGEFKTIACCGTNRSGKTFVASAIYARYLRDFAKPNTHHLAVTTEQRLSAKGIQKYLWDLIPHEMFDTKWTGVRNGFSSRNPAVTLDPGGKNIVVSFMTQSEHEANRDAFEGLSIESCFVDESVSHELFSAIKARLTLSDDGRLLVSSIPGMDWYYEIIYHAKPEDGVWYKLFTPQSNPMMTPKKWAELVKAVPAHEREVRLKGVPAMAGSIVYVEFNDEDHVVEPKDIPDDLAYYAGLDVGMDHPTVWLLYGVSKEGKHYVIDEYVSRNQTPEQDAPFIKAMLGNKQLAGGYTYIDPAAFQVTKANQVSVAQQYTKAGIPVISSRRTSDVGEMNQVYEIKEMIRCDELFVSKNCPQLIKEFHVWKYKRDRQNKPLTKDSFEDRNNDALDALRYITTMHPTHKVSSRRAKVIYT
jgi:hypothetical protein